MKFKRIVSLLFAILLMITLSFTSSIVANGLDEITISSADITVDKEKNIRVPIYISNNTGLMGFGLSFVYDDSLITPISVEYGEVIQSGLNDNIEGDSVPGEFKVIYGSVKKETFNGLIFYINFEVNPELYGTTKVEISSYQDDTFNENFEDVIINCEGFSITINQAQQNSQTTKPTLTEKPTSATFSPTATNSKPTQSTASVVKPLKLRVPKFTLKKSGKKIKINYKKVTGATGFQVRYKIKGKWKIKTFEAKKSVKKTIKVSKKGNYKVQLRAIAKSNNKTVYSNWSGSKKVKIK